MKKSLVLLCLGILFLSSGCTKEMTCTRSESDDDYTVSETVVVSYNNDIVKKFEYTTLYEMDEESVEYLAEYAEEYFSDLEDINGFSISYSKMSDTSLKIYYMVDYTKLSEEDYDDLGLFDDSYEEAINTSISDFKADLESDEFTCK